MLLFTQATLIVFLFPNFCMDHWIKILWQWSALAVRGQILTFTREVGQKKK
jgi:hypothetical protein